MIKASDLRIGNYLKGDELNIPKLGLYHNGYTKITGFGISMIEQGNITSLKPIPLTPEILEQCGFKRDIDKLRYPNSVDDTTLPIDLPELKKYDYKTISLHNNTLGISIGFTEDHYDGYNINEKTGLPHILYLHQLQNLFYSLTGEELTIKL